MHMKLQLQMNARGQISDNGRTIAGQNPDKSTFFLSIPLLLFTVPLDFPSYFVSDHSAARYSCGARTRLENITKAVRFRFDFESI